MTDSTPQPSPSIGWPTLAAPDCVASTDPALLSLDNALVYMGLTYPQACQAQLRRDLEDCLPTTDELAELTHWAEEVMTACGTLLAGAPVAGYKLEILISSYDRFRPVVQDDKRARVWVGSLRLDRTEAMHAARRAALRLILDLAPIAETQEDDEQPTAEVKERIDAIQAAELKRARETNEAHGSVAVQAKGDGSIQEMMAQAAIDYAQARLAKVKEERDQ